MKQKIVVVEDETDIRELIAHNLKRDGFEVETVLDGEKAIQLIRDTLPDLILLDLMIPKLDGLEVCKVLKKDEATSQIPIIMVTAKGEESDIVLGLGLGADDYLSKPFSPKELLARIKAVLRRGKTRDNQTDTQRLVFKDLVIDIDRHEILISDQSVIFTATEFKLLHFLATHAGRVFSRSHLLSRVIGEDAFVFERNIDVHIQSLRKKMGTFRSMIETVRGVGYRFRGDVE